MLKKLIQTRKVCLAKLTVYSAHSDYVHFLIDSRLPSECQHSGKKMISIMNCDWPMLPFFRTNGVH